MIPRPPDPPERRDLHLVPEWRWLAFALLLAAVLVALVVFEGRFGWPDWAVPNRGVTPGGGVEIVPAER